MACGHCAPKRRLANAGQIKTGMNVNQSIIDAVVSENPKEKHPNNLLVLYFGKSKGLGNPVDVVNAFFNKLGIQPSLVGFVEFEFKSGRKIDIDNNWNSPYKNGEISYGYDGTEEFVPALTKEERQEFSQLSILLKNGIFGLKPDLLGRRITNDSKT